MKIGLIGFGTFGQLVASILSKQHKVLVYDAKLSEELKAKAVKLNIKLVDLDSAAACDLVILAVPISKTEKTIKEIAPLVKRGALVADTCSVKILPAKWLKKYLPENVSILATHPMFGPYSTGFNFDKQAWDLKGLQIVLCPVRLSRAKLALARQQLEKAGLQVVIATPQEHDRQTATSLAFVHFLGRSIKRAGIGEQEIFTKGFGDVLKIYPHTNSDNWQLFHDMNNYNPYAKQVRDKFIEACDNIDDKIEKSRGRDDQEKFRNLIDKIDVRIIEMLSRRFKYIKQIDKLKREAGQKNKDVKRVTKIIKAKSRQGRVDDKFVKKLYRLIFDESYKKQ